DPARTDRPPAGGAPHHRAHHRRRDGERPRGDDGARGLQADGHRDPDALLPGDAASGERVPGVRGRGGELARARPLVLARGRGGDGGEDQQRARAAQPQDGARAARLVHRPLHHAGGGALAGGVRGQARALRPAQAARPRGRARLRLGGAPRAARRGVRGHRGAAGEGGQRAVRARLRQVHPLLQVRGGVRLRLAEHLRDRRGRPRLRRAHLHGDGRAAPRERVRVLRQLHRRVPHRRADVQDRARQARRRHVGRVAADADRHHLPLLRRGVHALAARAGQRDRARDVAARQRHHERQPVHQGALRLEVRAEPPHRPPRAGHGDLCRHEPHEGKRQGRRGADADGGEWEYAGPRERERAARL
ncbi:MAG: NADH-ubiquinone oxidoreductase chain G2; Formate dehydrogenase putative subunit, partial [uncultured Gemmatimonadaceae bacterium]